MNEIQKKAIRAAIRMNEIGARSPYELSFAGKGKSGASFGFMQGDLAAGASCVRIAFTDCLVAAKVSNQDIRDFFLRLSMPLIENPLDQDETRRINSALLAGSRFVDAMDDELLSGAYANLEKCIAMAAAGGRTIADIALLYMACWINMTGTPTTLLRWLSGRAVILRRTIPAPSSFVKAVDIREYLLLTDYFTENPKNFAHLEEAVDAGASVLKAS